MPLARKCLAVRRHSSPQVSPPTRAPKWSQVSFVTAAGKEGRSPLLPRPSLTLPARASAPQHAVEEALQLPTPHRVLELAHRLRLDLPHPLARHLEDPTHLLQRVRVAVAQPVTQLDDLALAVRQRLEHLVDLVFQHLLRRRLHRRLRRVVLDELAEEAVLALADRAVQADRMPADL